eukprot:COSAG01_NODE_61477_length_289_cov_1.073684_2_plen_30_part_01
MTLPDAAVGRFGALDLLFEQCSNNPMAVLA